LVDVLASEARDLFGTVHRLDVPPLVRPVAALIDGGSVCESEKVHLPQMAILRTTPLCHADKAKRLKLADCRADRMAMDAVFVKVVIGARQGAVIVAAVMTEFDLKARKNAMGGKGKRAIRGAL
jgi:hypothetical protein